MNARATRFPLFDSLRAIAALAIFSTHAYFVLATNRSGVLRPYASRLEVGVFVFFAISGFLLYRPFVRARLRDEYDAPAVLAYGWRRLLRIGPAYWVALSIVAVWLHEHYVVHVGNAAWLYLFGQSYRSPLAVAGLTQAWSLSVEAAFYVFLPLWAFGMRSLPLRDPRARLRAELAGLAALVAIGFAMTVLAVENGSTAGHSDFPLHLTLPCYLQVFAVGMCFAVLSVWYEERELPAWLRPLDRFPGLGWGLALVAFWAVSTQIGLNGDDGTLSTGTYVTRTALYTVVALGVVAPAVFGDQTRGLVRRLLANRVLLWIGLISYSLFLYHLAVIIQVRKWNLPLETPIALVLSLGAAALSYYAIERPALRLKRLVGGDRMPAGEAVAEPAPAAPPVTHAG